MSLREQLIKEFKVFGEQMAKDLKLSVDLALREHGSKNPQSVKLDFSPRFSYSNDVVTLSIHAVNGKKPVTYWDYIEKGRRPGAKNIPADVVGKKWQGLNNIDPRKIIADMRAKNRKSVKARASKPISFDKAAKSLSFIIQKSIKRKGIPAKPYIKRVIDDGRLVEFRNKLVPILGEDFILQVKGIQ